MKNSKIKYGFLFPGAGMDFTKHFHLVNELYNKYIEESCFIAENLLEINVLEYIKTKETSNEDKELLDQIVSYITNCMGFKIYSDLDIYPDILLGYSMGIYSALACGQAFSFEAGLNLLVRAYEIMKKNMGKNKGAMTVVIGLTDSDVAEIINQQKCNSYVEIVNNNSQYSIVISGIEQYVKKVALACKENGALKVVDLEVSIPYHSKFNSKSAEEFLEYIKTLEINDSVYPLISCISQDLIKSKEDIVNELFLNLKTKISWKATVEKANEIGFNNFIEVGTGDSLIRLSSFINRRYNFLCCQDLLKGGQADAG